MNSRPASPWPRWRMVFVVSSLLAIHLVLAFTGVLGRSVTSDETGHLTAGYSYWKFGDYRLQPENGNLPQRWAAMPLLRAKPTLDPAMKANDWAGSNVWNIAQSFLFESGNDTDFLLLAARSTMLFWSAAAGLLVFWWARSMWGDAAGVGALALFAFSPTTLAHGPLVTSDMCAAVCLLAALAAWWRLSLSPRPKLVLLAGVTTGLAFVAKFSAVLLLPVFVALLGLRVGTAAKADRASLSKKLAAASVLAGVITWALIWSFFGFRFNAADPAVAPFAHFYQPWHVLLANGGGWTTAVRWAREVHALPEAFLYGFSFVVYFAHERGAFLAGNFSSTGWWWFFPFAFLVKSTMGELIATGLIAVRSAALIRTLGTQRIRALATSPWMPLLLFSVVFLTVTLTSKLNIGQRHILPLYLVLFILTGALFSARAPRWLRGISAAAVLLSAVESLSNHPNHLAFFNQPAGGPQNGWRLLVDSSLDWGQDVAPLGAWVERHRQPNERVFVSCFGTADPEYEGIRGEALSPFYSLGKPRIWFELEPGLYCISATMLQDVYGIRPGPWTGALEKDFQYLKAAARINLANGTWDRKIPETGFHPENPLWLLDRLRFARLCQYLKVRKPDAVINHTQFVFRLSAEEVNTFTNRPYSALVDLMGTAAESAAK